MGAIELQVFVSLVVVLGAAFVALICDFLKGNNEQLRESNLEMRVRQDEREKRAVILGEVQRHTIETLVQACVAPAPVAAPVPQPAEEVEQPLSQAVQAPEARESFERTQQERSARRREGRRQQAPPATVSEQPVFESGHGSTWAENVVLRRSELPNAAFVAEEASEETALPLAGTEPFLLRPAEPGAPKVHAATLPLAAPWPAEASTPLSALTAGGCAMPPLAETLMALGLPRCGCPASLFQVGISAIAAEATLVLPGSGLSLDTPAYEIVEAAAPVAETESPVVRIRVLSESEILHYGEPLELELPMDDAISLPAPRQAEAVMAHTVVEPMLAAESTAPALPDAGSETLAAPGNLEAAVPMAAIEPLNMALRSPASSPIAEAAPFSPSLPTAAIEPRFVEAPQTVELPAEIRSNVVEMPVASNSRNNEAAPKELVIPGGFHEAPVLARLLEEETPFVGLALVISVVDYVVLLADQGKPAVEQLMGSVTRLVMSLAREQDFACRIAEDEFVLLFTQETGAAAKRRIQSVSERLWDFQLRSLGSVSVIFSWGASESTREPVVHAVEFAREQMLESRRNRRALASGVGRFRRKVANS